MGLGTRDVLGQKHKRLVEPMTDKMLLMMTVTAIHVLQQLVDQTNQVRDRAGAS